MQCRSYRLHRRLAAQYHNKHGKLYKGNWWAKGQSDLEAYALLQMLLYHFNGTRNDCTNLQPPGKNSHLA